jgi:hypothetical protein
MWISSLYNDPRLLEKLTELFITYPAWPGILAVVEAWSVLRQAPATAYKVLQLGPMQQYGYSWAGADGSSYDSHPLQLTSALEMTEFGAESFTVLLQMAEQQAAHASSLYSFEAYLYELAAEVQMDLQVSQVPRCLKPVIMQCPRACLLVLPVLLAL